MKTQHTTPKRLSWLILLLTGLVILSHMAWPVRAVAQIKLKTQLDVKQADGSWEKNSITISSPQTLTFRWTTKETGSVRAVWQVSETNAGLIANQSPGFFLATGQASPTPALGRYALFTVDTGLFITGKPTKTVKKYYLRIVLLNASDQVVGVTSVSIIINYVEQASSIAITKADVYGTYAVIYFTASTAVTAYGEASTKTPISGNTFLPADVDSTAQQKINAPLTKNAVWLTGLRPNTTYFYIITGKDKDGQVIRSDVKSFKTMQRRVTVTFNEVHVVDDSDDLSAGDLGIGFYVNSAQTTANPTFIFVGDVDTGGKVPLSPPYSAVLMNPSNPMPITVLGIDNDESDVVVVPPIIYTKLNSCGPLAQGDCDGDAAAKTDTFELLQGFDEPFTKSISISPYGPKLKLIVKGTISVAYVP
jgi:hypothetical protein